MGVILHIGRHKTGTSSLQHFLVGNAERLRDAGFDYPTIGRDGKVAHHFLAYVCNDRLRTDLDAAEVEQTLGALHARFEQNDSAGIATLLSSEAFQNCNPRRVAANIHRAPEIIVYLRNQVEYLVSAYAQAIQNQRIAEPVADWVKRAFRADYRRFLSDWAGTFGESAIRTRIYARSELLQGDIIRDVLELLGVDGRADPDAFTFPERVNTTIGGAFLEFKRRLNPTDFESVIPARKLYSLLGAAAERSPPELNRGVVCPLPVLEQVSEAYRKSNERLIGKFITREQCRVLNAFPERVHRVDDPAAYVAGFPAVAAALDEASGSDTGSRLLALVAS